MKTTKCSFWLYAGYSAGKTENNTAAADGIGGGRNGSARNIQCPALL